MTKPVCSVEACDKLARNRGWCSAHYERWRLTGDIKADIPLVSRTRPYALGIQCTVSGCERTPASRGLCDMHYDRWRRNGDPLAYGSRIIGDDRTRLESYIDRSGGPDACHPWTGGQHSDGYGSSTGGYE